MKKRLSILFVIGMMLFTLSPATVWAQGPEPYGGLTISGAEGTDWEYKENSAEEHELLIKKNDLAVSGLFKGAQKLRIIVKDGVTSLHLGGLKPAQARQITLTTDYNGEPRYDESIFVLSLSGENEVTKMYFVNGTPRNLDEITLRGTVGNSSLLTKKNVSAKKKMNIVNLKFAMDPNSQDGARLDSDEVHIENSIVNVPSEINYYEKAKILNSEVTTQRIVDANADGAGGKGTLEARGSRFFAEDGSASLIQGKNLSFLESSQVDNFVDILAAEKVEISGSKITLRECISGLDQKEPYPDIEIKNGELTAGWMEGKNITFSGASNVSISRPEGMPAVRAAGVLSFDLAQGCKVEGKTKGEDMLAFLAIQGITFATNNKIVLPQDGEIIDVPLSDELSGKGIGKDGDYASYAIIQYEEDKTPIDPDSDPDETPGGETPAGAPPTGDDAGILLFAGLALAALIAMAAVLFARRRGRK